MKRTDLLASINLKEELVAEGRRNRPGGKNQRTSITIHNTDNTNKGADANAHSSFVRKTGYYVDKKGNKIWVSWHYTVDDTRAIRQIPDVEASFHAGSAANSSSISIEVCMHSDNNQPVADDRAARLAALLLYDNKLPITAMYKHEKWTGKKCPSLLRVPAKWTAFTNLVSKYLDALNSKKTTNPGSQPSGLKAPAFAFVACPDCGEERG